MVSSAVACRLRLGLGMIVIERVVVSALGRCQELFCLDRRQFVEKGRLQKSWEPCASTDHNLRRLGLFPQSADDHIILNCTFTRNS